MIETYAFLVAFTVQIFVVSVLYPLWFIRYVRRKAASLTADRLAQLYPDIDLTQAQERFLTQYRALIIGIAVLGLLLLGWLFSYVQRPHWDDGAVEALITVYFLAAQLLPISLLVWLGVRFDKVHRHSLPDRKRTATLQRRGLFDFVSPLSVSLAVLSYAFFAAFVIYIQRHPFPGFAGVVNLAAITLVYALNAFVVYTMLYGKNKNPFEPHADRLHTIGLAVKSSVHSCIAVVAYLSINFSLGLLDLQRWEPFALSVFFVITVLLASIGLTAPPHQPDTEGLNSSAVS